MASWLESSKDQKCGNRSCQKQIAPGDYIYRKSPGAYLCGQCGTLAENEPHLAGEVEQGVLDDLGKLPPEARSTALAKSMIKLSVALDLDEVPPREVPAYTKELRLLYMQLRELFPSQEEDDPTQAKRDSRERRFREGSGI